MRRLLANRRCEIILERRLKQVAIEFLPDDLQRTKSVAPFESNPAFGNDSRRQLKLAEVRF
jgi:hypothetical protein